LGVDLGLFGSHTRVTEDDVRRKSAAQSPAPIGIPTSKTAVSSRRQNGLPAISPRAARAAAELGVDWTELQGSGRGGRIRERDVRACVSHPAVTSTQGLGTLRRTIADRVRHSFQQTVPVTLTARAAAPNLVSLRDQFKASGQAEVVPTYTDIIAKVVAGTLLRHPDLNSRWDDDRLVSPDGVHIGIAVDTKAGLLVPVITAADQRSLLEFAQASRDLVARARERRLAAHELQGGTFTITNLGSYGVELFTPIINWPEVAILGVGAIRREPVAVADDRLEARWQLPLSLTFDHRAIDGAPAARYLQTLRERLETPAAALISG